MPEVHIPFTKGQDQSVDPKLQPQGGLQLAENVRFRKDARFGSRYGYVADGPIAPFIAVSSTSYGAAYSVHMGTRLNSTTPAKAYQRLPTDATAEIGNAYNIQAPTRYQVVQPSDLRGTTGVACYDSVVNAGYLYCAYGDSGTGAVLATVAIIEPNTGYVVTTIALAGAAQNVKMVVLSGYVCVFYADVAGNAVKMVRIDTSYAVSAPVTVVATLAASAQFYDVADGGAIGTRAAIVYIKDATHFELGTVDAGGTYAATASQLFTVAHSIRPTICADTVHLAPSLSAAFVVVWLDGVTILDGIASWGSWDSGTGAVVQSATSLDLSGNCVGMPVIAANYDFGWSCAFTVATAANVYEDFRTGVFTRGFGSVSYVNSLIVASKPFRLNLGTYVWMVDHRHPLGPIRGAWYMVDIASPHASPTNAATVIVEATCAQFRGWAYDFSLSNFDPRGAGAATVTAIGSNPGLAALMSFLPTCTANSTGFSADMFRFEYGPYADTLLSAKLNGQVLFSGARMLELNGANVVDTALFDGPRIISITTTTPGGAAIADGSYDYILVWEWHDDNGRVQRSAPSAPFHINLAGGPSTNVVNYAPIPAVLRARSNLATVLYRTQASGTIFYRCVNLGYAFVATTSTPLGVTDNGSDAIIGVREVLYTQGERGGLSGLLPNDSPPPCKYLAAGNDRLLLGGLEDPSAVQWSKRIFPGEPIQYSDDNTLKSNVDAAVTGVATLDGLWYVFTRDSIWLISGDGPDDNGGGSSFGTPAKLPSDTGAISQRSIVVTQEGILFQGRNDRIYLIPRGQNPPIWMGQPVRDTLAAYPFIVASTLAVDENCVYWACINQAMTDGRLIIYDTRNQQWYVDKYYTHVFGSLCMHNGKLLIDGYIAQTAAFKDDDTGSKNDAITETLITGDARLFGVLGYGRCRKIVVLGEIASSPSILTIYVSYDSGQTWGESKAFTVAGSVGAPFKKEHPLVKPRGDAFTFKVTATASSPGAGLVLNDITIEAFPSTGTPRLANADRG